MSDMAESSPANLLTELGKLMNIPPVSIEIFAGDGSEFFYDSDGTDATLRIHRPFMLVENNLGVPQKILYKVYMLAVKVMFECRQQTSSPDRTPSAAQALFHSSAVVLLANPAHQTALNVRKQLVQDCVVNPEHELRFTEALLTVREASKQSILWHHRRWLCRYLYSSWGVWDVQGASVSLTTPGGASRPLKDDFSENLSFPPEILREEFIIVSRACETYPRNYHAWAHRYICLQALAALISPSSPQQARIAYSTVLADEYAFMRQWVERHVSDYTAIQYLCSVHACLPSQPALLESILTTPFHEEGHSLLWDDRSFVAHARSLVEAYPDHESLWLYLRASLFASLGAPRAGDMDDALKADILAYAQRFIFQDTSQTSLHSLSVADSQVVRTHACRFLAWHARQTNSTTIIPDVSLDIHGRRLTTFLNL